MKARCSICNAQFQRSEHLERHIYQHLGLRPFSCSHCGASFARRDALQRHMLTHRNATADGAQSRTRSTAKRVGRACRNCARAKQRCDGKKPCRRCESKNLACFYPVHDHQSLLHEAIVSDSAVVEATGPVLAETSVPELLDMAFLSDSDHLLYHLPYQPSAEAADTSQHAHSLEEPSVAPFTEPSYTVDSATHPYAASLSFEPLPDTCHDWFNVGEAGGGIHETLPMESRHTPVPITPPGASTVGFTLTDEPLTQSIVQSPAANPHETLITCSRNFDAPIPNFTGPAVQPEAIAQANFTNQCQRRNTQGTPSDAPPSQTAAPTSTVVEAAEHGTCSGSGPLDDVRTSSDAWKLEDFDHVPPLQLDTYDIIKSYFAVVKACEAGSLPFELTALPSMYEMNSFMQLYFEDFQPVFPLLHQSTFKPSKACWVLVLAVVTTGCRFSRVMRRSELVRSMQEFLRRAIHISVERHRGSSPPLWLSQAAILSVMGLTFSGDLGLVEQAHPCLASVATLCRKAGCFGDSQADIDSIYLNAPGSEQWEVWANVESKRRLAHCAWLLDCQQTLFYDLPSVIPTDLLRLPLPCHDSLWEAPTGARWAELLSHKGLYRPKQLRNELSELCRTKRQTEEIGDFNMLLLTFGIYKTSRRPQEAEFLLDIIRYQGNSISRPSRLRWLTLQHHHIINIILRIHVRELFAFSGWRVDETVQRYTRLKLKKWVESGGYAVRRVVINAAQAFCCIRDHDTYGQHEVHGLLVACLTIWVYTSFALSKNSIGTGDPGPTTLHSDSSALCLDGHDDQGATAEWSCGTRKARPYISGIGCLEDYKASARLIRECVRILSSRRAWPISDPVNVTLQEHYICRPIDTIG